MALSKDYYEARERAAALMEQRTAALHSYLNICGLSGEQIRTAMLMFLDIMKSDAGASTIADQDMAETQQRHEDEMAQHHREFAESRQAAAKEEEDKRTKVYDPPIEFMVCVSNTILIPFDVTAASIEEAETKARAEFDALTPEQWLERISEQGCDDDSIEIFSVDEA